MFRLLFLLFLLFAVGEHASAQIASADPMQDDAKQAAMDNAEKLSQQIRIEERRIDLQVTGLKWLPWSEAGKPTQDYIAKRDQYFKSLIGSGRHVDFVINDMDGNGQPDIVLFFWDHCGFQGCLYKVYFDRETKKPEDYFGWDFIPYKNGVMLDSTYFSL